MKISIGAYLIARMNEVGIRRMFGVPGDYSLEFLELIEKDTEFPFINTCNELNASNAADGDARITGISAVCTTYGVGDLAALSGIAGAYAEYVPVVLVSGMPPLNAVRSHALMHHTLADGDFDNVRQAFSAFTVAQALITPENAACEIDRVLLACWRLKRPVLLQLPSDICFCKIEAPEAPLTLVAVPSDPKQLEAALSAIMACLRKARQPVLLLDSMARAYQLRDVLTRFVAKADIPFATIGPAKSILDETSPYFLGIYSGKSSTSSLYDYIAQSDCVIAIGVRFVEATSAWFSQSIRAESYIDLQAFDLRIGSAYYPALNVAEVLEALTESVAPCGRSAAVAPMRSERSVQDVSWSQTGFWARISHFLLPGDLVIAENGTSQYGTMSLRLPEGCKYISQPVWGSIGYTLPALLGATMAAPERRSILFIGDGSFQLTVQELSTILRNALRPIIFLINNHGYTIERLIMGKNAAYNDVASWRYTDLPQVFGPKVQSRHFIVDSYSTLERALKVATHPSSLVFIEVRLPSLDVPQGMEAFGAMARSYDYGRWGQERDAAGSLKSDKDKAL